MTRTGRPRTAERIRRKCDWCGVEYEYAAWEDRKRFHTKECYWAWKSAHKKPAPAPKPKPEPQLCSMGDGRRVKGHDYCEMHLLRVKKYGDPNVVRKGGPRPSTAPHPMCRIDGCDGPTVGFGLCRNHYMRQHRRGGDPAEMLPRGNFSTPVATRVHMFVQGDPDDCWPWLGYTNKNGYGSVGNGKGSPVLAHRAVYEELVGPIGMGPDGKPLTLDHLCGNIICVNPNHLDPCTLRENHFRGGEPHFELRGKAAHYD